MPTREPVKVILDSSFLFVPSKFHVDIFEGLAKLLNRRFEPIVLSPTYEELQRIAREGSTRLRKEAVFALKLAQRCRRVEVAKGEEEPHDDVVIRVAVETASYVATNDRTLRKRLRSRSVPVIYLRQRSRLALNGVHR